jgi:hypothetical protein
MAQPEGVAELVDDELEVRLSRQHHFVTPRRSVEAAMAVGDRVDDVVVASGVEAARPAATFAGATTPSRLRFVVPPQPGLAVNAASHGVTSICSFTFPKDALSK